MSNIYTPGPWNYDGEYIYAGTYTLYGGWEHHQTIGKLGDTPNWEANAKLIAAAPDLLDACKEVLSVLPVLWGDHVKNGKITLSIDENVFYQLESAINKAKGV